MKATEFEYRHQTLVHQLIVAAAFLTYLIQPDDIVWRLVKDRPEPHALERAFFIVAALFIGAGAALCTKARAKIPQTSDHLLHQQYVGEFSYAVGLGSLAPPLGCLVLIVGEGIRLLRLKELEKDERSGSHRACLMPVSVEPPDSTWKNAFRREVVKWGVVIAMIAFVITLGDRVAEVLLALSFLLGLLLNAPFFRGPSRRRPA